MAERRRDTSRKRESILDAAAQVFADEGYETTSMDRVADVARASKRTVYNHFPSKEALLRAVLGRFMAQSAELKQVRYDPKSTLEAQLGRFADAMLEITRNPSWLGILKVMTGVVIRDPSLVGEIMARMNAEEDTLATWLEAATADGLIVAPDPVMAAKAFWASLGGAFLFPTIYFGPMASVEVDAMKNELIQTFLARYRAPVVRESESSDELR